MQARGPTCASRRRSRGAGTSREARTPASPAKRSGSHASRGPSIDRRAWTGQSAGRMRSWMALAAKGMPREGRRVRLVRDKNRIGQIGGRDGRGGRCSLVDRPLELPEPRGQPDETPLQGRGQERAHLSATPAMARAGAASVPVWPSWAPTSWPVSWRSRPAIITPRSPATRNSYEATPGGVRSSPRGPARFSPPDPIADPAPQPDVPDAAPPALERPHQQTDHQGGQRHHPRGLPG
jgi:hypothetical protein